MEQSQVVRPCRQYPVVSEEADAVAASKTKSIPEWPADAEAGLDVEVQARLIAVGACDGTGDVWTVESGPA